MFDVGAITQLVCLVIGLIGVQSEAGEDFQNVAEIISPCRALAIGFGWEDRA